MRLSPFASFDTQLARQLQAEEDSSGAAQISVRSQQEPRIATSPPGAQNVTIPPVRARTQSRAPELSSPIVSPSLPSSEQGQGFVFVAKDNGGAKDQLGRMASTSTSRKEARDDKAKESKDKKEKKTKGCVIA